MDDNSGFTFSAAQHYDTLDPDEIAALSDDDVRDFDEAACRAIVLEHVRTHKLSTSSSFYPVLSA